MNLVPFQAVYPNLELVTSPESFFGTVKSQFVEYNNSGFFKKSSQESLYVYKLKSAMREHIGIITCTDIQDFISEKVLKHENTLAVKEQQMMNLMLQNRAMVKPVLLAYDGVPEINKVLHHIIKTTKPFLNIRFEENNETHTVYEISDGDVLGDLMALFQKKVPHSYIADGHHRVKTSILLNQTNLNNNSLDTGLKNVLSIYFSWQELSIFEYNRIAEIFQFISPLRFMAELSKYFKIKLLSKGKNPKSKQEMTMYMYGDWYRLKVRNSVLRKHKNDFVLFDTFLLNEYVFKAICNIENVREDSRIKYLEGIASHQGIEEQVSKNENRVGFCLFPIDYHDVKKIADNNLTLPPKSTWFEPRIKNGILVKDF